MREQILQLEENARLLEPDSGVRDELNTHVLRYADHFLNHIRDGKGYEREDTSTQLYNLPISESGRDMDTLLSTLAIAVDHPGINPASGGHLGYIPGGGVYPSALADYLADVTNRYAGIYFANPGAVRIENMLIRWMSDMIGYPVEAQGNLTSGGSIANLVAITTARDALQITSSQIPASVIYLTEQTHHCVHKALRIAGMVECVVRQIPLDSNYRMDSQKLQDQIVYDKEHGFHPRIVIASLGSTDTGAVDLIDEIANIASTESMWLQIDAAYGGFFQLVPELRHHFIGVEKSDSYILDPHKGLFLPYGTGTVLIKNGAYLQASHWYKANYMQDATNQDESSPADLSPELTKHFRGLRMWLPLQLFGIAPFRAALKEKWLLAQYFYEKIRNAGFETGPVPQLSVVTYRYTDGVSDPDTFNRQLIGAIHRDGRIFISSTMIDGVFWLRLAVLCFRTHLWHVDVLLEMLITEKNTLLQKQKTNVD
jgi:glutamate/tyrosine decarboxylase-like PLP-dependent enzyme